MWSWTSRSLIWLQHQTDKPYPRKKVVVGHLWTVCPLHGLLWKGLCTLRGSTRGCHFESYFFHSQALFWSITISVLVVSDIPVLKKHPWFWHVSFYWLFILIPCGGLGKCQGIDHAQLFILTKYPSCLLPGWWLGWAFNWNSWNLAGRPVICKSYWEFHTHNNVFWPKPPHSFPSNSFFSLWTSLYFVCSFSPSFPSLPCSLKSTEST